MEEKTSLTYRDAGVDIDAGNKFIATVRSLVKKTEREGVMSGPGGFAALFELPLNRYRHPVLVSGTDGVGTKLRLALDHNRHSGVGIDLVAMCVNDVVVQGAEPLFFLDYFATGQLDAEIAEQVVGGIADGCVEAGAALIGGETAELPGFYDGNDYDLAGFCVGIVEKEKIIDGRSVCAGDVLIGLPSTGPHSNGYSLIRKVLDVSNTDPNADLDGQPLIDRLLRPTAIYVRSVLALAESITVNAIAHITGGGLIENVPRVLPSGHRAVIDTSAWDLPPVFDWLRSTGNIEEPEMYRTFNCGIGLVICISESKVEESLGLLEARNEQPIVIGRIEACAQGGVRFT